MIDDRNETKRGMWWLGSATLVTRIIDVAASLVILARLTREDMGTAALVLSAGAVIEAVSGVGIGQSIVKTKSLSQAELDSLFWLTSAVGVLLGLSAVGVAPLLAHTYGLSLLAPMTALTGIKLALVGAAIVPQHLLTRQLMFRETGAVQALSTLGEALAKIGLAVLGFGAWAPISGNIFRGVVLLLSVLAFSGFRPRLHFSWPEARPHLQFGARLAGSSLIYQSYKNADYFLVGRLLGLEALGLYRVAFDLGMQPLEVVMTLVNRVSYPIYAKLSHDARALKTAFLRSTRSMTLLAVPAVAFLFFAAEDVLALVTHGRWAEAAPGIRVLAWGSLLRGAALLFPQVYVARGRANLVVLDALVSLVVLVSAFYAGLAFLPELGMLAVCWAWVVAYPGLLALHVGLARSLMALGPFEYLKTFVPGVGAALVMVAAMTAAKLLGVRALGALPSVLTFALVGLAAYAAYLRLALKISFSDLAPKKAAILERSTP